MSDYLNAVIAELQNQNEDLRRQRDDGEERYKCLFAEFTRLHTIAVELTTQRDELVSALSDLIDLHEDDKCRPAVYHATVILREHKGGVMTDQEKTWLANLKAGDDVIIASVIHPKGLPDKVHRITPSQIIIKDGCYSLRYLKRNGRRIGPCSGWIVMPEVKPCG